MNQQWLEQLRDERWDLLVRINLIEDRGASQTDEHLAAKVRLEQIEAQIKKLRMSEGR